MEISDKFEELLKSIIVRVITNKNDYGTGFFVAPTLIATAAHNLSADGTTSIITAAGAIITAKVIYQGKASVSQSLADACFDAAILEVDYLSQDYAWLNPDINSGDSELYTIGYSPRGSLETEFFSSRGYAYTENCDFIKLGDGQAEKGNSGAPLLNLRTGGVCGLFTHTRNAGLNLGGYALPIAAIDFHDGIRRSQRDVATYARWARLKSPLRDIDGCLHPSHYFIFPSDKIDVADVFVTPRYQIWHYESLVRSEGETSDFFADAVETLNNQHILFLFGPFGVGKSIATKVLQKSLFAQGWDTVFIPSKAVLQPSHFESVERYIHARGRWARNLVIAFDGFDEVSLLDDNLSSLRLDVMKRLVKLSSFEQVYVIVNSRMFPEKEQRNQREDIYLELNLAMEEYRGNKTVTIMELAYYDSKTVEKWINFYAFEKAKAGKEQKFFYSELKRLEIHLRHASKNPLFLYLICRVYYFEKLPPLLDVYYLYDLFVERTIKGKFKEECLSGSKAIEPLVHKYRRFLQDMAVAISCAYQADVDAASAEQWNLDNNAIQYRIKDEVIRKAIQESANTLLEEKKRQGLDMMRLEDNVLTCYFLETDGESWRFRDNNVLFFLLSQFLFDAVVHGAKSEPKDGSIAAQFPAFGQLSTIPLNFVSLFLLFERIKRLNDGDKTRIKKSLLHLYHKRGFLKLADRPVLNPKLERRLHVLLALVFINIFQGSYSDIPDFFLDIDSLARLIRVPDEHAWNALRAFFRGIDITDAVLSRIDLTGYNLQNTIISNGRFGFCELNSTVMNGACLKNVCFESSILDDINAEWVSGEISFINCHPVHLTLKNPNDLTLKFHNCTVKLIHIHNDSSAGRHNVSCTFSDCKIDCAIFRKTKVAPLIIESTQYPTLKVQGSVIRYQIDRSSKCLSNKQFEVDGQTELREI